MSSSVRLECTCSRHPLLAVCGRDERGRGFVHVKAWKQQKLITEAVVTEGTVSIKCRECYRWTRVTVVYAKSSPVSHTRDAPPDHQILAVLEDSARPV